MVVVLSPILIQNELMGLLLQFCVTVTTLQLSLPPSSAGSVSCRTSGSRWMWTCSFLKYVSVWGQLDLPVPRVHLTAQHICPYHKCKLSTWTAWWSGWTLAFWCIFCRALQISNQFPLQKPAVLHVLHLCSMPCFVEHHTGLFTNLCSSAGSIPIAGGWAGAWVGSCWGAPGTQWLKPGSTEGSRDYRLCHSDLGLCLQLSTMGCGVARLCNEYRLLNWWNVSSAGLLILASLHSQSWSLMFHSVLKTKLARGHQDALCPCWQAETALLPVMVPSNRSY